MGIEPMSKNGTQKHTTSLALF